MPEPLRLFFALWPDIQTRQALSAWQSDLSGRKILPENLHITLAFLGEKPATIIPGLSQILESISSDAIRLKLDKMGYFPHSRISWAGMEKTPDNLTHLYKRLAAALSAKSISYDKRNRFKPHITLARHSNHAKVENLQPIIWDANRLVLVESRFNQGEKGGYPLYTTLAEHILGN